MNEYNISLTQFLIQYPIICKPW